MFTLAEKVTDSVGKRLLQAMLAELVLLSPRYNALTQEAQQEVIDRLRGQLDDEITHAVHQIAAQSFETVPAKIASVAFRDEVKATLTVTRNGGAGIHALADRVGGACMLVLCDDAQFKVGLDSIKGTPNQGELIGPGDHGPGDGDDDEDDDE